MSLARRLVALLPATLVLAGCVVGVPTAPTLVTSSSAVLNGQIGTTTPDTVTWWFEYGTSTAYGRTTERRGTGVGGEVTAAVYAVAPHLSADTTHHLRLCVQGTDGAGPACSADATFRTTAPQDSVFVRSLLRDPDGVYHPTGGLDLLATSRPDGTEAAGTLSLGFSSGGADNGPVRCVRVEGGRATVGTVRHVYVLVDNGDADRDFLTVLPPAADPSVCPAPVAEPQYSFFDAPGVVINDAE